MMKQTSMGRLFFLLGSFLILGSSHSMAQCPTEVFLDFNQKGNSISVKPGTVVNLNIRYSISNARSCPGCIDQILLGIENRYIDCIYSGMPSVCPSQKKGNKQIKFKAPDQPGVYRFYFNTSQDYNCKPGLYKPSSYLGTLVVEAPCTLTAQANLNINNQGNRVTVKPGASLDMVFDYSVGNQPDCPGCITQVLWGIDNRYMGCVYNGNPGICSNPKQGRYTEKAKAPAAPGTYQVYLHPDQNYSCNPAAYRPNIAVGTITVQADCPPSSSVNLRINGGGNAISAKPGERISLLLDYNLANQSGCATCFSQLMVGYGNQYLACIFDGTPAICPAGTSGQKEIPFTAPAIPGRYTIAYNFTQDYSCKPALYRPDHIIGTVEVVPDCSGSSTVTLNMNGLGNQLSVAPGTPLNMQFSYNVSAATDQPVRILYGFDNTYQGLVFDGRAAQCPDFHSGNQQQTIMAPAKPGVYRVYYCTSAGTGSNPQVYKPQVQVGTVTVTCPVNITVDMNGQAANYITAAAGTTINMRFRYEVSGNPSCNGCSTQVLVGVNDTFLNCIFNDQAIVCPSASTGYATLQFSPPGPGYYKIYYTTVNNSTCGAASYKAETLVGTINVPQVITEITPQKTGNPVTAPVATGTSSDGNYYALLIGVSNYREERLNLDKPEIDARELRDILVKKYSFEDSTITVLYSPTREKILEELYRLRKKIKSNDNLLIFYAGHGYFDKDADQGYWWPSDAKPNNPANWLSNSDLREQIKSIKSKHTLLISDACFSGGIFKTRDASSFMDAPNDILQLYKMPSRRAMTSGTLTTVPDRSVFLEYLNKHLKDNTSRYLSSQELFYRMRSAVIGNSPVVPQTGIIFQAGDEGGDFIFVLK